MVGFVLSGGASLGAVQAGMLRALYEREIAPELIVGTSAGAVNGAYIASRPATVETAESLASLWRSLRTLQVFPPNPVTALLALIGASVTISSQTTGSRRSSRPIFSSSASGTPRSRST